MQGSRIIIVFSFLFFSFNILVSQDTLFDAFENSSFKKIKLHHIKGQMGLDARYMSANLGPAYELNYVYLINNQAQFHVGGYYENGGINKTVFNYKNLKFGLSYSVFKIKQRLYINPDLSLLIGVISGTNSDFNHKDEIFNFGFSYGLNSELYILNKLSFIFSFDQQYNFKDNFGKLHFNTGGGLRVYFN